MPKLANRISEEDMLADLRRVAEQEGGISLSLYEQFGEYSRALIVRRLGSGRWSRAIKRAGLDHFLTEGGRRRQGAEENEAAGGPPAGETGDRRAEGVQLLCLKCDQPFLSVDRRRNRICSTCKDTDDWRWAILSQPAEIGK